MIRLARLLPIVAVVGLAAACTEVPPPPAAPPPASGYARGIDLAKDARDYSQELKGSHLDFVARYYRDPASRWPALTAAEAKAISDTGLRLVAVWEWHSGRPDYFTNASGYADGMAAYRQAKGVGQPPGSAIYFAVDFNPYGPDIQGRIDPYFRGVRAGFQVAAGGARPDYRVGVYGSGAVCDYLKRTRLADYAWLSNATAWWGYDKFTGWDIRQYRGASGLSFDHDTNEARGEYGGFQVGTQYTATAAAPVAPAPVAAAAPAMPFAAPASTMPVAASTAAVPVAAASAISVPAAAPAAPVAAVSPTAPVAAVAPTAPAAAAAAPAATQSPTGSADSDQFAWLNSLMAGLQAKTTAAPAPAQ